MPSPTSPTNSTPPPSDVHPGDQRSDGDHDGGDQPAPERAERVAGDDAAALRSGHQQPAREARIEVARDRKAGEHTAEGRRLQEHEGELKRRVAGLVVEVRHVGDARQAAGERGEEEQREDQRGQQDRGVDDRVVHRAPGDASGDEVEAPHVRTSLFFIAAPASDRVITLSASAKPKPSASAWPSQPVMIRLRTPSIR